MLSNTVSFISRRKADVLNIMLKIIYYMLGGIFVINTEKIDEIRRFHRMPDGHIMDFSNC